MYIKDGIMQNGMRLHTELKGERPEDQDMEEKKKLYIVEDDGNIRRELQSYLAAAGYQATAAEDFSNVAAQVLAAQPNLVLLDMNLPGISGLHICEQIREKSQVPVIFVTGNNTSMDELNCLLRGGDDFVSKPYQLPVLMARIAAVLRRTAGPGRTEACQSEYKGVTLDLAAGKILRGDCVQELTRNELKILHCLWKHPGEIVSRADLIDELWDHEVFIDDNTLSVNITRIRNKLKEIGAEDFIETKRGLGYRI